MTDSELYNHLAFIYGAAAAGPLVERLQDRLDQFRRHHPERANRSTAERFSERDAVLITYGDMVQAEGETPLATLAAFTARHLRDLVSAIHILPFYPYSSDDGFSVVDYRRVNPALGDWQDVAAIGRHFQLMFDAVINHISAESDWFQAFLHAEAPYDDYFTVVPAGTDLSAVFRPRALPLLTPFETAAGRRLVWTTFSADQIDLNYGNPDVLLEVVDTVLFYVEHGADLLRLDAIAFMWKEPGTSSIHLPQTHRIIQLLRSALDQVAPDVLLITETNVPHADNVSYFGNGHNEAQMVYNFSLPPLTLHAFHTGDARTLSRWAAGLETPSAETTFFNFLASHDGIGLTPARGILDDDQIRALAERVEALGGLVSYKSNGDGSQSAYELNINYLDALGRPGEAESDALLAQRFLAAQAIMLALQGVPGIYFHSLFGSRGWPEGVAQTGRARTINRQKLERTELERALADPHSLRARVVEGYSRLLRARRRHPAFHPRASQQVLDLHPALFSLLRRPYTGLEPTSLHENQPVLALHNVAAAPVALQLNLPALNLVGDRLHDLLADKDHLAREGIVDVTLAPYEVLWLVPEGGT